MERWSECIAGSQLEYWIPHCSWLVGEGEESGLLTWTSTEINGIEYDQVSNLKANVSLGLLAPKRNGNLRFVHIFTRGELPLAAID